MISILILTAIVAAPPQEVTGLKDRLKELSELARRIDSGETTLIESRKNEKQPDRAMRSIREHLSLDPDLKRVLLDYVRSGEEPEAARALAILALSQPARQEMLLILAALLEDPPTERLAQTVFAGFQTAIHGDASTDEWMTDVLEMLPSKGRGYQVRTDEVRIPPLRTIDDFSFGRPPKGVSYRGFADSIVAFLAKDKFPALRYQLRMADRIFEESHYQGGVKQQYGRILEKVYLEGKEGWGAALEVLVRGRVYYGIEPVVILGKGLRGLSPAQRVCVLGEVFRNHTFEAFRPPFADYLDEAIELIGSEPKATDLMSSRNRSNDSTIIHVLIRQSLNDEWAERILIKSASVHLRRQGSDLIHRSIQSCDRFEANRYSTFLERMIKDTDGVVVGNARAALKKSLDRKPAVFDDARAAQLRRLVD